MQCPACCELSLTAAGPDKWRIEYPPDDSSGLCPRGSTLGELLNHPRRILTVGGSDGGRRQAPDLPAALGSVLEQAGGQDITILLDGGFPCEQLAAAAAWCRSWRQAKLCFVIEPADEQLIKGIEASGAAYLRGEQLGECDGFVIIGDAFSANPICSRSVLDRRHQEHKTPIVVIDPAGGKAAKFASHRLEALPGGTADVLAALAGQGDADAATKQAAGALANCKRIGVLVAAEYARTAVWEQIGYLAGKIAGSSGGVAPQTIGANAISAVRMAAELGTISLAEAMADKAGVRVAVGCDVLGMLGWSQPKFLAAAASLPNRTTDSAQIVLPVALPCECVGTYLLNGEMPVKVAALMKPPAGVPTPAELIGALAALAGAARPDTPSAPAKLKRLSASQPLPAKAGDVPTPALLLCRDATQAGAGALTGCGTWQSSIAPLPVLSISPSDAEESGVKNFSEVSVSAGRQTLRANVRVAPELSAGAMVLSEGLPEARGMCPCRIDTQTNAVISEPVSVKVSD